MSKKILTIISLSFFVAIILADTLFYVLSNTVYSNYLESTSSDFISYLYTNYKFLVVIEPIVKQLLVIGLILPISLAVKQNVDNILVPSYKFKKAVQITYLVSLITLVSVLITLLISSLYMLYVIVFTCIFMMMICIAVTLFCNILHNKDYVMKISLARIGVLLITLTVLLINAHITLNDSKVNENINDYYDVLISETDDVELINTYKFNKQIYSLKGLIVGKSSFFLKDELEQIKLLENEASRLEAESLLYLNFNFIVDGAITDDNKVLYDVYSSNYKLYANNPKPFIFIIFIFITSILCSKFFKVRKISDVEGVKLQLENTKVIQEVLEATIKLKEALHLKLITKEEYDLLLAKVEVSHE